MWQCEHLACCSGGKAWAWQHLRLARYMEYNIEEWAAEACRYCWDGFMPVGGLADKSACAVMNEPS